MPFYLTRPNLVLNGGFEEGLAGWTNVSNVGLEGRPNSHEGLAAAAMGKPNNTLTALMQQDVPICPRRFYRLILYVAGLLVAPADLTIDLRWLDTTGTDLGTALEGPSPVLVPAVTIGAAATGAYRAIVIYTAQAPSTAVAARIILSKAPGAEGNLVLVDDVLLEQQG
ncbi:MAG: hypothetical protein IMW97_07660 [Firmicutes bacterium]|nr:hypothetical protein [Candidatus Fermentithermobacillaceae bacterium]